MADSTDPTRDGDQLLAEIERLRDGLTVLSAWLVGRDLEHAAGGVLLFRDGNTERLVISSPPDTDPTREELIDALLDCAVQGCYEAEEPDTYESGFLSAYADALRLLARCGRVEILLNSGRHVVARLIRA
jgi:hypothetical protein